MQNIIRQTAIIIKGEIRYQIIQGAEILAKAGTVYELTLDIIVPMRGKGHACKA